MMQPASTMKLFSTAVALDRHGPEHSFSTDVLRDAPLRRLTGPSRATSTCAPTATRPCRRASIAIPNLTMATLARNRRVGRREARHGRPRLRRDRLRRPPDPRGWKTTYLGAAYAARVSALSLNENIVWVVVQPAGKEAAVTLEPMTTTIPLRSKVRSVGGAAAASSRARGRRRDRRERIDRLVERAAALLARRRRSRALHRRALRAALQAAGVTVDGAVRPARRPRAPRRSRAFASPPLSQIVSEMNRESINIVAELLFRDAARASAPNGMSSAEAGLANLREFLGKKVGADPQSIRVFDGSGLSTLDYLTPRTMIQLLSYAHKGPWSAAFHGSLPVAGESELLRRRMRGTPAEGNLHAKTGTTIRSSPSAGTSRRRAAR
jgi:D-alanyl-D-alanine carboxypeptidase/D-alanyl-D-alanine-endopeptidase (penicillin-binding protein 4)